MLLSREELSQIGNWSGLSPADVLQSVHLAGGWEGVFPLHVPKAIHLVRNYFNEYPREFSRCTKKEAKALIKNLERSGFQSKLALTSDWWFSAATVYKDRASRLWFQMAPIAGAYHKGDGKPDLADQAMGAFASQSDSPYKLISPDGTGGSSEVILLNPNENAALSTSPGTWFSVKTKIDLKNETEGTYNFSETVIMGAAAHNLRDVQTHKTFGGDYAQVEIFTPLVARRFP